LDFNVILNSPGTGYFPFDPKVLTRIYLGKQIPAEKEGLIREWARQRIPQVPVEREPDPLF
jgi:hypothetical protein